MSYDPHSSYICDKGACIGGSNRGRGFHCYHESLLARLSWQYGEDRANRIVLGIDARTETDKAAWRGL